MNNPNPLIPQGSLLKQKAKSKPHLRVAYIIVGVHLVFLGGLLIQGCKRVDPTGNRAGLSTNETSLPPLGQAELPSNSIAPTGNLAFPDIATSVPATSNVAQPLAPPVGADRSEEHTSELQSPYAIS